MDTLVGGESPFAAEILAEELETEGPVYTRSNGDRVPLKTILYHHLKSAHAKLARDWPGHPEIAPMAAEIAVRDAAYQAEQAALAESVS